MWFKYFGIIPIRRTLPQVNSVSVWKPIKKSVTAKLIITNGKTDHWGQITFDIKYPLLDKFINQIFINEIVINGRKLKFKG